MKTDRELLELAARADGYREAGINKPYTDGLLENWNPLTDDGDAFRLSDADYAELQRRGMPALRGWLRTPITTKSQS